MKSNSLSLDEIKEEFLKCKTDAVYFISKYIKVSHPKRGLVNFDLYPFQRTIIKEFFTHRFNILRKFRQAGCTTLIAAYSLWLCMFNPYKTVAILSKGEAESTEIIDRIKLMHAELPAWLQPKIMEDNKHTFKLENKSVIKSKASGKQSGRSIPGSLLILDEAAFIEHIDTIWAAAYPIISTGGSVIALSTVNGIGNWFHKMYTQAVNGENNFNAIDITWKEHPEYFRQKGYEHLYELMAKYEPPVNIDDWEKNTRANLSLKEWLQEYEANFLGTGETYIDGEILRELKSNANREYRIKYNNRMRVWKDPQPYHEYVIACDPSIGRERDYSAFHVIDLYNGEQVAEFYSNRTPINEFAKIIVDEGRLYNTAYVLSERNGIGNNLIYFLQESLEYENLVMDENREIGMQITQKNREVLLADMEHNIRSNKVKINSERLVDELLTFVIDKDTNKIKADTNCHDDLIMAFAMAINTFNKLRENNLIERDTLIDNRNIPLSPMQSYKYKVVTATGNVTLEDYKWLIGK
jgi:hypothetical protein